MALRALIAGASGLVGGACLDALLAHPAYAHVTALSRRPLGRSAPKLSETLASPDQLTAHEASAADHAFCALGTTIRTAGSQEAFRRVDLGMVSSFASFARRCGASTFVLVSSVGADAASRNFYLRVKGEAEQAVAAAGFNSLSVLRPSLLLGRRVERRPGEALGQRMAPWLAVLLQGRLRRYRAIPAATVGLAMVGAALANRDGTTILHFDEILAAARPGHSRPLE